MKNFKLNIVLNAHLPFVRHPEKDMFFEETWLFEAIDDTYLPLLRVFHCLEERNVPFKLTISLSPTLVSMLADRLLQDRYRKYVANKIELGRMELRRTQGSPEEPLARMYLDSFERNEREFNDLYGGNLLKGFAYFQKTGHLDIITSLATYCFAPLYQAYPKNILGQLRIAIENHYQYFGQEPVGLWLAENGYYPGLDNLIAKTRIRFVFLAAHGVLLGEPRPNFGVLAPIRTPAGLVGFGRHLGSSNDVWDKEYGYPADPVYREFYRDIGYDLPMDYVGPYLYSGENRSLTGYKYYRITGKTDQREYYDPRAAALKVKEHAGNFLYNRKLAVEKLAKAGHHFEPIFTIPLDAELLGHWWFEGVQWLEELFLQAQDMDAVSFVRPTDLDLDADYQTVAPMFSSWGTGGFAEVWLDGSNDWIYRHSYRALDRFFELLRRFPNETGRRERALNQAAREILLAQSSDWPMMIKTGVTQDYARSRIQEHLTNFLTLYDSLSGNHLKTEWLTSLEKKNNIFPRLDYRVFL